MLKISSLISTFLLFVICVTAQKKYYLTDVGIILDSASYQKSVIKITDSLNRNNYGKKYILNQILDLWEANIDSLVFFATLEKTEILETRVPKVNIESFLKIGTEFPLSNVFTLDNDLLNLEKLKGKPTLINCWFTTCKPCVEEMNSLNEIKEYFKDKVNFISLTTDEEVEVRKFLETKRFNFQHIVGQEDKLEELGINSFPKNVFLDKHGRIIRITGNVPIVIKDGKKFEDKNRFIAILEELL